MWKHSVLGSVILGINWLGSCIVDFAIVTSTDFRGSNTTVSTVLIVLTSVLTGLHVAINIAIIPSMFQIHQKRLQSLLILKLVFYFMMDVSFLCTTKSILLLFLGAGNSTNTSPFTTTYLSIRTNVAGVLTFAGIEVVFFYYELACHWLFLYRPVRPPSQFLCGIRVRSLLNLHYGFSCTYLVPGGLWLFQIIWFDHSKVRVVAVIVKEILFILESLCLILLFQGVRQKSWKKIRRYFICRASTHIAFIVTLVISAIIEMRIGTVMEIFYSRLARIAVVLFFAFEGISAYKYMTYLRYRQAEIEAGGKNVEDAGPHDKWAQLKETLGGSGIPEHRLKVATTQLLGSGNYGQVYKATLSVGRCLFTHRNLVAVKAIQFNRNTPFEVIQQELKNLMHAGGPRSSSPNVVRMFGATVAEGMECIYLVMEYCSQGSLVHYLTSMQKHNLVKVPESFQTLVKGIAGGMVYLQMLKTVHGDLAARNILLGQSLEPKISDFGMSQRLYNYQTYATSMQDTFPWKWMAPESLEHLKFSFASDVWSYGVVLWEIFSLGSPPWPTVGWTSNFVDELKGGVRLERPYLCPAEIYHELIGSCWDLEPGNRPSFQELYDAWDT